MKVESLILLFISMVQVVWPKPTLIELNQNQTNETRTTSTKTMNSTIVLIEKQPVASNLVYKPKELDEVVDYEIETLEAMRNIERNASSKSVLNLFKLMDHDRDGKLSFEELMKFLNYDDDGEY